MSALYWYITGKGKRDLVLLHGWGLNAEVWLSIVPLLSPYFCLHLVDLPGFGRSKGMECVTLQEMVELLLPYLPSNSLLLGWSLGGLVATQLALSYPELVDVLINVTSSPCFVARYNWPGINICKMQNLHNQLSLNFRATIEKFINLQLTGIKNCNPNMKLIKQIILAQPMPTILTLKRSLTILQNVDLRESLPQLKMPFLRLYGLLDVLVPISIVAKLDMYNPNSSSIIMKKSGHAPFLSHPDEFCQHIINFLKQNNN